MDLGTVQAVPWARHGAAKNSYPITHRSRISVPAQLEPPEATQPRQRPL